MNILFVVTAFYPEQAVGSIRITKLVKFLERQGDSITVLSLAPPPWARRDETLYFESLKELRWASIDQSAFFRKIFMKARVAAVGESPASGMVQNSSGGFKYKVKSFAQFFYSLMKAFDWLFQVRRYARRNLRAEKFDVIFSSYPSIASPVSALMLKRMGFSDVLAIDFRDPLSYGESNKFSVKRFIERLFLRNSQLASFASKGVMEMVSRAHYKKGFSHARSLVLNNGYDSDDLKSLNLFQEDSQTCSKLRIVYTGALYGGKRDLQPFFLALSSIFVERENYRDFVEIHYAGYEGPALKSLAGDYNLQDMVIDHGRVSRNASLQLQAGGDVSLLATWNTVEDQGILTGKMFEFFLLRKPVLALVSGNLPESEVKEVLDFVGAGFCYEEAAPNSYSAMVDWLKNIIDWKDRYGEVNVRYNENVDNFNFEKIASDLQKSFRSAVLEQSHAVT